MFYPACLCLMACLVAANLTLLNLSLFCGLLLLLLYYRVRLGLFSLACVLWALLYPLLFIGPKLPLTQANQWQTLTGTIVSIPQTTAFNQRFDFLTTLPSQLQRVKVRLRYYGKNQVFKIGERYTVLTKLKPARGYLNPGSYPYQNYLLSQGIQSTGYIKKATLIQAQQGFYLARMRLYLSNSLAHALGNSAQLGVLQSLTLGLKKGISQEQWQLFRLTGTGHLMAISGLHVGLMAGVFYMVALFFWRRSESACLWFAAQRAASLITLICVWGYGLLTGLSIPTQRALIMLSVFLFAKIANQLSNVWQAYSLSMLLVLLISPLSVYSPGFYLSYFAVFILLYCWFSPSRFSMLKTQVAIMLGLLPLSLYFFSYSSLISLPANLVAIPLISFFILPASFLGLLLYQIIPSLGALFIKLCAFAFAKLFAYLAWLSQFTTVSLHLAISNALELMFAILAVLLLLLPRKMPLQFLSFFLLLPIIFAQQARPLEAHFNAFVLDVGQGLAVVVNTEKHTLVFDTGPRYRSGHNTGDAVVIPFLRHQHINTIDKLVISHHDIDHRGGENAVRKQLNVKETLHNRRSNKTPSCHEVTPWQWEGVHFEFLSISRRYKKENNQSCVLKISGKSKRLLLTGDIEKKVELDLVKHYGNKLKADFLVAPHHGSKSSSSLNFINAVAPKRVIFSTGMYNRFHFPNTVVVNRYQRQNIQTLNTAVNGMQALP